MYEGLLPEPPRGCCHGRSTEVKSNSVMTGATQSRNPSPASDARGVARAYSYGQFSLDMSVDLVSRWMYLI